MQTSSKCIVIATGGSGGHVIPSEVLAKKLKKEGIHVVFCGHGVSQNPYFSSSLDIQKIDIPSAPISLKKMGHFFLKNIKGFKEAFKLYKQLQPVCLVGFGSYHSFSAILAAYILKIPIVLYEANTAMGKVIKLFSKKAECVASPFAIHDSLDSFFHVKPLIKEQEQHEVSRDDLLRYFSLEKGKKTILVMGGSQGSKILNTQLIKKITSHLSPQDYQIIHLVGKNASCDELLREYQDHKFSCCVKNFETNMHFAYLLSDLIIARSGATTLFELDFYKKPAILIPFAQSKDNHQLFNASYFIKLHKGCVIEETLLDELDLSLIIDKVQQLEQNLTASVFNASFELHQRVLQLC